MTAAAAALVPGPLHGPGPGADADEDTEVISWADFKAWERQLATSSYCTRPIRLRGHVDVIDLATGETAPGYDTAAEPGGVLTIPCGNRRGSRIVRRGSGLTKTAAQRKLKEIIRDYEDGLVMGGYGYTVADAVNDWLAFA